MSATLTLFERWKAIKGFSSDRSAVMALGLSHTVAAHWRNGRNGSAAVIDRMCKDLGEDPIPVIIAAFAEASRDAEDRRTLMRLARRFTQTGLAVACLLIQGLTATPATAHYAGGHPIHYAPRLRQRIAVRILRALLPPPKGAGCAQIRNSGHAWLPA